MTEGHNSNAQLKSLIERIEAREADKQEIADDIKEIYKEADSAGFDTKALRAIIRERKQDVAERQELEAIKETYRVALGMLSDTPLGQAALARNVLPAG
jgi:uncharacterized protein (UPF0335 family)